MYKDDLLSDRPMNRYNTVQHKALFEFISVNQYFEVQVFKVKGNMS